MVELMRYLERNGFRVMIVSGNDAQFLRGNSEGVFRIPRDHVIGSHVETTFRVRGSPGMERTARVAPPVADGAGKAELVYRALGRSPVIVVANADDDIELMQLAIQPTHRSLVLVVRHDDPAREYAYDPGTTRIQQLQAAAGWIPVSVQRDFKRMFQGPVK